MPKLVVILGPTVGLEHPLRGDVIIGRDPRCEILVPHREVSGQHARITRIGDRYFLEDLGSRNGTRLNDKRIQRHVLEDADKIRIGRTSFRFDAHEETDRSMLRTTDSGTLTVELDATRDLFRIPDARHPAGHHRLDRNLKLLCDVSRSIGALSGLKSTLDEIAATLLEVFPHSGRVIILLSADGVSLEPVVTRWRREPETPTIQYSDTVIRKALAEKRAILTVDALSDDRFAASRSVVDLRLRSLMCAPILHREKALGVVELDTLDSSRMFNQEDLNLMTGIVAQVAFAVGNAQLYDDLRGQVSASVSALTTALGFKSPSLLSHSERVSRLATMMARRLELPPDDIEELRLAGLLHDIGFLTLPDSVLPHSERSSTDESEPDNDLDPETWALLQSHSERGTEILSPIKPLAGAARLVLAHHEHFDGQGYPCGLKGEEIPLGARILAVIDTFDAITAACYYQHPRKPGAALDVLHSRKGSQFDPEQVALFERIWEAKMRLEARRNG